MTDGPDRIDRMDGWLWRNRTSLGVLWLMSTVIVTIRLLLLGWRGLILAAALTALWLGWFVLGIMGGLDDEFSERNRR